MRANASPGEVQNSVTGGTYGAIHQIRPIEDPRWRVFVANHPRASMFHSVEWLEALRRTYRFKPVALTTSPPSEELQNGLAICRVDSCFTGKRLVSLPFSDHCEPLLTDPAAFESILSAIELEVSKGGLVYAELRPLQRAYDSGRLKPSQLCCWHQLALRPDLQTLFRNLHKDSVQRKIRRAKREGVTYEDGRSPVLLEAFWSLYLLTRRRHQAPPQPKQWFQNLINLFDRALKIRVAFKEGKPIAAILTVRFKSTLVYKYGCSDSGFQNLGGTHLLLWKSIEEASRDGLRWFDLGRSDCANAGLITFKDRWGAQRSDLTYSRITSHSQPGDGRILPKEGVYSRRARRVVSSLPEPLFSAVGSLVYRHIG